MKQQMLLAIVFLMGAFAHAGECRLNQPVPLRSDIMSPQTFQGRHALWFKKGLVDHLPKGDVWDIQHWKNGELEVDIHQLFTGEPYEAVSSGYFGTRINGSTGMGVGFPDLYIGGFDVESHVMQQAGETVYTVTEHYGTVHKNTVIRTAGNNITSIQLTVPVEHDGPYKGPAEADTICVLQIEPDSNPVLN